ALQWLDDPSARVLEFALRRLRGEPAGLLASARDPGHGRPVPTAGTGLPAERLTRLRFGPLTFGAFQSAVRASTGPGLSLLTIRRVFDASGGNPFYGLELARALRRAGAEPSPEDPLPVPADLQAVVSGRLAGLPAGARDALLVVSCLRAPTTMMVEQARGPAALAALQTAASHAVIEGEGPRGPFAHPP